ncbi:hypothetical protein OG613_47015 (plasmid) [Streptomyces sp. NBC_00015]|uniref:hypothetical protein n=1 Tax=Streptomyces sp. NBC_00015 TaxID=2903611 RepID=UPI002F916885
MKLISCATGREIEAGRKLYGQSGAAAGLAWRFERIAPRRNGVHHVHVSRPGGRKLGRIHREFHPSVFGCEITVEITWRRAVRHAAVHAWAKADDYLLAGVFALVPLAFFEHFHWAEAIVSALGMDGH